VSTSDDAEDDLTVADVTATVTEVADDDDGAERSDLSLSTLLANVFNSYNHEQQQPRHFNMQCITNQRGS